MYIEVVYLKKDVLKEPHLKDEGLAVYTALRRRREHGIDFESYQHIAYLLSGEIDSKPGIINRIKKGLDNLADLELIKVLTATKIGVELDTSPLHFSTTQGNEKFAYFLTVNPDEISRIFTADNNKHPMKMLRYFCCIVDSIYNKSDSVDYKYWQDVGCQSVSKLAKSAQISESAALDYNNFLEKLNLISICRAPEGIVDENGRIINGLTNCYGRPEHSQVIEEFQSKRIEACSSRTAPFGKKTNKKRSMKQKYNELVKGKAYSQAELREMQEHFEKINSNYDKGISAIDQKYRNDEISFEQYEIEMNHYQEAHKKIDLTPITATLEDVWKSKSQSASRIKRRFYEEDDDSLYDFLNRFSDSSGGKNSGTDNTGNEDEMLFEVGLAGYRVDEGLVMHFAQALEKGMQSKPGIRNILKKTYECDAEQIKEYMAAIERCNSQEYDSVI